MAMDKEIAISVLNELIVELEKPEFQKGLKAGLQKVRDDDVKEKKKTRQRICVNVQAPIVAKYGFESTQAGVDKMLDAIGFNEQLCEDPDVKGKFIHMFMLTSGYRLPSKEPQIPMHVQRQRGQGYFRPLPKTRFPIVELQEFAIQDEGRQVEVLRPDALTLEETDALVSACNTGDSAKAGQLLGKRRVGGSSNMIAVNVGYRGLGSAAVKTLVQAMGRDTVICELDISGNNIGVEGAKFLAENLPKHLRVLKLNVSNNRVGLSGIKSILQALPQHLEVFHFGIASMRLGPPVALAIAENMIPKLTDLSLDLTSNSVGDEGVLAISHALPQTLAKLALVLYDNSLSRKGLFSVDRQIEDPLHSHYLPNLTRDNFQKAADLEVYEFKTLDDGHIERQLDWKSNI